MDPLLAEFAKSITTLGPLFGVLVVIIVTGLRRVWVPGFAYDQMKAERDAALASLDKFVGIHESQTDALKQQSDALKDIIRRLDSLEDTRVRRGR